MAHNFEKASRNAINCEQSGKFIPWVNREEGVSASSLSCPNNETLTNIFKDNTRLQNYSNSIVGSATSQCCIRYSDDESQFLSAVKGSLVGRLETR